MHPPEPRPIRPARRIASVLALGLIEMILGPRPAVSAEAPFDVYVTNEFSGDLTVIDGVSGQVSATVPLGKRPRGLQASSDHKTLYIALSGSPIAGPGVDESKLPPPDKSADGIGVLDIGSRSLRSVYRNISDPEQVAVSPDGRRLYIASEDTESALAVETQQGTVLGTTRVGGEPEGIAVRPDSQVFYVAAEGGGTVTAVDTRTLSVIARIPVGERPRGVAFDHRGTRAYVTCEVSANVAVIDAKTHQLVGNVKLAGPGLRPMGIVVSPDDATVYVTTGRGGTLVAIDAKSLTVRGSVAVGPRPWGLGQSPDGRLLYTANGSSDDVSVIEASTLKVLSRIKVGTRPWGIAVVPRS